MGVPVDSPEPRRRDVCVDLCRREALVAQQLLDDPKVGPAIEEVRGEGVTEGVRRDAVGKSGAATEDVEPQPQPSDAEGSAPMIQEDLGWFASLVATAVARRSLGSGEQHRAAVLEIRRERLTRGPAEQPDSLLAALAEDSDLAPPEFERRELRGGQLADPKTSRIGHLDQRSISQGERGREPGAGRRRSVRGGEFLVHDREEPLDLVDLQDSRQASRQTGCGDRPPRIAWRQTFTRGVAVKRADGRQPLGSRATSAARREVGQVRAQVRSGW